MKKAFKNISLIVFTLTFLFGIMCPCANALSGSSTIAFSGNDLKVGETLKVILRISADETIKDARGFLTFDNKVLKFLDATGTGDIKVENSGVSFRAASSENTVIKGFNFEVIGEGSCVIKAKDLKLTNGSKTTFATESSARFRTASTQNNTQDLNSNKKAALTSISVVSGTLTPAFNSDITEYTVVVPYTQTDGVISCESLDPRASITVEGSRELQVGNNTRTIVVVASNSESRRYTITFNRLDENGNDITVSGNVTDIVVNVDGKDYNIAEQDATLEPPVGFSLATVQYEDREVTAYKDASGKTVLLYLIEVGGQNGDFFLYEDSKVSSFAYISTSEFTYIVKDVTADAPEGLYKATYELNGKKISCYKYADVDLADFVVFSAISVDGNIGYYNFDIREKTVQRIVKFPTAVSEEIKELTVTPSQKYAVVSLIVIFVLLFVLLIVMLIIKSAKKNGRNISGIFDSEEEYEMDSSSSEPNDD